MEQNITQFKDLPVTTAVHTVSNDVNKDGYHSYQIGNFRFERDTYFAHIHYPTGAHTMEIDHFLMDIMRDVAWGFFYGWLNFDQVFGTCNRYGAVDVYAGTYNGAYREAGTDYIERFDSNNLLECFRELLSNWVNEGFDPFKAPMETGTAVGVKNGNNDEALAFKRETAERMVGCVGDTPIRTDEGGTSVNRQFTDVNQDEPEIHAEPGFESEISAYNFFAYLSRSPVVWNPSICSVVKASAYCPTSEEHLLPVIHGNDRCEWFLQLSDEIIWETNDKLDGKPRARIVMKAGDVAVMPADISHAAWSAKRSMLLVWENMTPGLEQRYGTGELPPVPATF
jgi:hypothetical protein